MVPEYRTDLQAIEHWSRFARSAVKAALKRIALASWRGRIVTTRSRLLAGPKSYRAFPHLDQKAKVVGICVGAEKSLRKMVQPRCVLWEKDEINVNALGDPPLPLCLSNAQVLPMCAPSAPCRAVPLASWAPRSMPVSFPSNPMRVLSSNK